MRALLSARATEDAWADVWAHAERVLNSRPGTSPATPAYGIAGGAERLHHLLARWPHSAPELEWAVVGALMRWESRLGGIRVCGPATRHGGALALHLEALGSACGAPVRFDVWLRPAGRTRVVPC